MTHKTRHEQKAASKFSSKNKQHVTTQVSETRKRSKTPYRRKKETLNSFIGSVCFNTEGSINDNEYVREDDV